MVAQVIDLVYIVIYKLFTISFTNYLQLVANNLQTIYNFIYKLFTTSC